MDGQEEEGLHTMAMDRHVWIVRGSQPLEKTWHSKVAGNMKKWTIKGSNSNILFSKEIIKQMLLLLLLSLDKCFLVSFFFL